MRKISISLLILFCSLMVEAQSVENVLSQVKGAQYLITTVYYKLSRIDSLVTGQVRKITGLTKIQKVIRDNNYGYRFWTIRNDANVECMYDGNSGMVINHHTKEYESIFDKFAISHLQESTGQAVFRELLDLDTTEATGFELSQDNRFYYLTMHLPDITKYDVTNRYKKFWIDKKVMLPLRMKNHQETAGKVQDLYYEVTDIDINDPKQMYDFAAQRFPPDYKPVVHKQSPRESALLNKLAPTFKIFPWNGEEVTLEQLKGKTVLLDFSEIWCGPCLASLPKVQELYKKYISKGLLVYAVSFERNQLDAFEKMAKKLDIKFPIMSGDEGMRKAYEVDGIPKYIIINKDGLITLVSTGYPATLEEELARNLGN